MEKKFIIAHLFRNETLYLRDHYYNKVKGYITAWDESITNAYVYFDEDAALSALEKEKPFVHGYLTIITVY